ncbi:NHLP leader peptide family natural product precursor [Flavobacterium sp. WLB]|uniref:NHLP leader peptide family RiPP precursor n=1 Tax=unclassified Flavobacterium TaxID=196869 RepID=UPI0006ABA54D|nr:MULTISPECIES: NHLP leader peptide family RiPP precursor [unclassified Flavobacterium]KOP39316.1 TOMM propeptide domain-containing protein [Flavobacterium sp. VMW]OWU91589.1 TOMM propeptide domain-containing protein [Flavobacterium sp. NLM]PUU70747.1 NHLP leader peptide family natural product precursor [Flavobacterium sp. WLB]
MEQKKEEEVLRLVISKAWEDSNFRKSLITDPIKAIENLTGAKIVLPEGKTLVVNDQTDKSKVYMNIPSEPNIEDIELTEEQLEIIAGGGQTVWIDLVNNLFPALKDYIIV